MICITPIAGLGTRTNELGPYKPFIEVDNGNTILHYCIASSLEHMKRSSDLYCFICTKEQEEKYDVTNRIKKICYGDLKVPFQVRVVQIDKSDGQLETIYKGVKELKQTIEMLDEPKSAYRPVVIVNSDQYNRYDLPNEFKYEPPCKLFYNYDIALGTYFEDTGKSAYFKIKHGRVKALAEKKLISNYASSGLFIFRNFDLLVELMETVDLSRLNTKRKEDYLSHCINSKIRKYFTIPITSKVKIDLGNIEQIMKMRKDPFIRIRGSK